MHICSILWLAITSYLFGSEVQQFSTQAEALCQSEAYCKFSSMVRRNAQNYTSTFRNEMASVGASRQVIMHSIELRQS